MSQNCRYVEIENLTSLLPNSTQKKKKRKKIINNVASSSLAEGKENSLRKLAISNSLPDVSSLMKTKKVIKLVTLFIILRRRIHHCV